VDCPTPNYFRVHVPRFPLDFEGDKVLNPPALPEPPRYFTEKEDAIVIKNLFALFQPNAG